MMGRKLEPYSITAMKSLGNQLGQSTSRGLPIESKKTIRTEIIELKELLLEKIKNGTSISKSNHMIEVITNLDDDGIERLYFHAHNMNYEENHALQQDCYGRIDENGIIEVFKSREPQLFYDENTYEEAYSAYSAAEKDKIDKFKKIIAEGLDAIKRQNEEWNEKSFFYKLFSKIMGKKPKTEEKIKKFMEKLPEHLKEVEKESTFTDSIKVKQDESIESNVKSTIGHETTYEKSDVEER